MKRTTQTKVCHALAVLLLTLLLFVDHTASRPSTENENVNENVNENESDIKSLPPGADNIEIHHVEVVNGVNHEDHPVIMYKEDFVNEDYDPTKNETKSIYPKLYKRTQRTRHHHSRPTAQPTLVEEKILFDVLPETPLILNVDDEKSKSAEEPTKLASLHKYPKKYHSRHRRHAYNPHVRQLYGNDLYAAQQPLYYRTVPAPHYLPAQPIQHYQRYPTIGKPPKYQGKLIFWQTVAPPKSPDGIGNRDNFGDENSLFHNSDPAAADFSVFDQPRPDEQQSNSNSNWDNSWRVEDQDLPPPWGPTESRRPSSGPARIPTTQAPIWSHTTSRPVVQRTTTRRPVRQQQSGVTSAPPRRTTPKVSKCVWAIVNCCSQGSTKIRYSCFEEFGCHGAFWGVNPCAEDIRTSSIARLA